MSDRRPPPRPGNNAPRRGPKPGGPARRPPHQRRPADQSNAAPALRTERDRQRDQPRQGGEEGGLERLQKVLAHAGVSSRRACEDLIRQGRITVDGQTVRELGTKVDPRRQQVAVDGQKVHSERNVYYAVHKPKGYVCTNSDPAGKPLVINLLPEIPQRAYTVGRLDEQSTGLMLLTNDGELANKLAHPKFGVEKVYRVVVAGEPGREVLDQLTQGIWLAEGKVRAKRVKITARKGQATVMEMVLSEGKNREIRRMLAKLGHKVMSLTRIAVGPVGLKGLGIGECRPLNGQEIDLLRKVAAGLILPSPSYPDRRDRKPRPEGTRRPAPHAANADAGPVADRRPERPRPEGRGPTGPGRPQRPPSSGQSSRPVQDRREGQGPGGPPGRPQRPPASGQSSRPVQGPREGQGQGGPPGRPQRPPYGNGPRLAQGQNQGQGRPPGHDRGPTRPATSGPARPRPRPPLPRDEDVPNRRIIGLIPEPAPQRGRGPTGPRLHRPGPKRPPRAAQGLKRPPKSDEGNEE